MMTAESCKQNVISVVVYCLNLVPRSKVVARLFQEHRKVPLTEVLQYDRSQTSWRENLSFDNK